MEIEFHAPHHQRDYLPKDKPLFVVYVGEHPNIEAWFDVVIINHRTDRPERIRDGRVLLQKRRFRFWRRTITQAPLLQSHPTSSSVSGPPIRDIELPALSGPVVLSCIANAPIRTPPEMLPKYMELVLELRMIGPIRRVRRLLDRFSHDPTQFTSS